MMMVKPTNERWWWTSADAMYLEAGIKDINKSFYLLTGSNWNGIMFVFLTASGLHPHEFKLNEKDEV